MNSYLDPDQNPVIEEREVIIDLALVPILTLFLNHLDLEANLEIEIIKEKLKDLDLDHKEHRQNKFSFNKNNGY